MLLWSAVVVLCVALLGLTTIILFDVHAKGWPNWVSTVREWQNTVGTVAGFLSAASVLLLSSAIQDNAELARSARASDAIGQALAYEVERLVGPLQRSYGVAQGIDLTADDVIDQCKSLYHGMQDTMIKSTPVYDAVLADTRDFGDYNLALFTRVYGFYTDYRDEIALDLEPMCEAYPVDRIQYVLTITGRAFAYYEIVRDAYPNVTPLLPGMLPDQPPETS